jgi:hypothetical protein
MRYFLLILICCLTFVTGCVKYDLGIDFQEQHRGAIVQHIQLGEQLSKFSQAEVKTWLNSIEKRAKKLAGKAKRVSPQELVVTIPFSNGQELATKFNQFFLATEESYNPEDLELLQLNSELSIFQSNWIFVERNRLSLNIDLRALGVLSEEGNLIISPGDLIDLEFTLQTPWGGRSLVREGVLIPELNQDHSQLVWQLKPGEINQIEAVFWTPSYLGIGGFLIIFLVWAGFSLKYKTL